MVSVYSDSNENHLDGFALHIPCWCFTGAVRKQERVKLDGCIGSAWENTISAANCRTYQNFVHQDVKI